MKFSCSNIAWTKESEDGVLKVLKQHQVTGIEVAPCVVWPKWVGATTENAVEYRKQLEGQGFCIPAMQGIMFDTDFTSIFDERQHENLLKHLSHVAKLSESLGSKIVIFGAPKLRKTDLTFDDAISKTLELFRRIARMYHDHGSIFCVEPCGLHYGSDFVRSVAEATKLIQVVDSIGFGLHIDSGALHQANEIISDVEIDSILHYHISEPDLVDFTNPVVPQLHNLQWLKEKGYVNWCSVEMKNSTVPFSSRGPWEILKQNQ